MRITKRQLSKIIKEEKLKLLKEYEVYVDEDGNVHDDEGNVEKKGSSFGKRYGGETYTGTNQPWMSGRKKSVPPMAGSVRGQQLAAVEAYLVNKPSKFLQSLADQMNAGKKLSGKQLAIMKKVLVKHDRANEKLFEGKMRITKRQLKRIIKEEKDKVLRELEAPVNSSQHHYPSADQEIEQVVEQLKVAWQEMELKAWSAGDPSMNMHGELSDQESKELWGSQVETATDEFKEALGERLRATAIEVMEEYTDKLIVGEYN